MPLRLTRALPRRGTAARLEERWAHFHVRQVNRREPLPTLVLAEHDAAGRRASTRVVCSGVVGDRNLGGSRLGRPGAPAREVAANHLAEVVLRIDAHGAE
jgi:hypothetical protein